MRFLSVNLDCFLIELESLEETMAVHYCLKQAQHPHIKELIPAARSILVYFDPLLVEMHTLIRWISSQKISQDTLRQGKEIVIGVRYNGIDLNNVAELQSVNQETIFQQQSSVDNALAKKCEVCGSELVNYYRLMNQHRIAIMQEHILARNLDIVLFSRKADSQSE
jgi:hypothetical protein